MLYSGFKGVLIITKERNKIVKKSNAIIRAHWQIESIWEPRLVALLASMINVNDEDFKVYTIPISKVTGRHSGSDYHEMAAVVDRLMGRVITISESSTRVHKYNIFSKCTIDTRRGILELGFHPDLKPHYLNLKGRFTQYSLAEFMSLSSIYSQRIYEILKSWNDKAEIEITLDDLHEMLDTPASFKSNFAFFRRKVLEQAHKDIVEREGSSLWFDWEPIKSGRAGKVVAIHFVFDWRKVQEMAKNQPTNEFFIHVKLQRESNRCFERIVIHGQRKCTPKPKTAKCKFCLERGRMYAQKIVAENQGKF
jgi:plasmid replication initiation protein